MIRIFGDHLGEPTEIVVADGCVRWAATVAPGTPLKKDRVEQLASFQRITLEPARYRGLGPAHAFGVVFATGAAFAHMPWLAVALGLGTLVNVANRSLATPHVLLLAAENERVEIVVDRRSLDAAKAFVAEHGRVAPVLPTARAAP